MPTPSKLVYRVCAQCSKGFSVCPARLKIGRGVFCSKECFHESIAAKPVQRVCLWCSKNFEVQITIANKGGGIFCGRACSSAYRWAGYTSKAVSRVCVYCSETFSVYPNAIEKGGGVFCSKECCLKSQVERALPLEARFWKYVNKTEGCWLWTGGTRSGYGAMKWKREPCLAHRLSWEIHNGPVLGDLWVLHKCDVHACVRPDHLFLGTPRDNTNDRIEKRRGQIRFITAFGETKPLCRWLKDPRCCVKGSAIMDRIQKGFSAEYAISTPPIPAWESGVHSAISRGCVISADSRKKILENILL